MSALDVVIKAIIAANKFLFAAFVLGGLVYLFGPGDPPGQIGFYNGAGLVSAFCGLALLYEIGAALWTTYKPAVTRWRERKIEERNEHNRTKELLAQQPRILSQFDYLDKREKLILRLLHYQKRKTFHAPRSNNWLFTLRNRGFLTIAPGEWAFEDPLYEIPDFVWQFLDSGREEFGKSNADRDVRDMNVLEPWRNRT